MYLIFSICLKIREITSRNYCHTLKNKDNISINVTCWKNQWSGS